MTDPDREAQAVHAAATVDELLDRLARSGDVPFLKVGDEAISAGAFALRVRRLAAGLRAAGMAPGDRLVLLMHRCVDEAVALLAAITAGGLAVPLHARMKSRQVLHVLQDCEPWAVVTSGQKADLLEGVEDLLGGRRVFHAGAEPNRVASVPLAPLGADAVLQPPAPGDAALLLYTSGSTGLAKAVVQNHRNLALGAAVVADYLRLSPHDHVLGLLPLSFDYGLNQLLSAMHVGCRVTMAEFLGAGELQALFERVQPTGLAGVPTLWHEVARGLSTGALAAESGRCLRYITNSGGRLDASATRRIRESWPEVAIFSMYGLTEAFRSAFLRPERIDEDPLSFGMAVSGVELFLVDPVTHALIEGAGEGELVHAGAFVADGYWRRPDETARRFGADPRPGRQGRVVFTGDLVRRDDRGLLYFVARLDGMLKVSGHRISPDEIAAAVADLEGVVEATVFGGAEGERGHRIVLAIANDRGEGDLEAAVMRQCRSRLPAYMVPHRVLVMPRLPRTPNGKIDVPDLRRRLQLGEWD